MKRTHGLSSIKSPIYKVWQNMMQRTTNKNLPCYKDYGGRGIAVCERWKNFQNFYDDMGEPSEGLTIDRVDVNGNYCKENCRWATRAEQVRNTRASVFLTDGKKIMCKRDWTKELGINEIRINYNIQVNKPLIFNGVELQLV